MIIIERSRKDQVPAWDNSLTPENLFPDGQIPFQKRWALFELILNKRETGIILGRRKGILRQEDIEKSKGSLRLVKKTPRKPTPLPPVA